MKTPFDFAKDILKDKKYQDISPCDDFSAYLVQRCISGASPEYCNLVNVLLNTRLRVWRDEQEIYDFLKCCLPKMKRPSYTYFSAKKAKEKEADIDVETIAAVLEISRKEVKEMLTNFPDLVEGLKEEKEKILKRKK